MTRRLPPGRDEACVATVLGSTTIRLRLGYIQLSATSDRHARRRAGRGRLPARCGFGRRGAAEGRCSSPQAGWEIRDAVRGAAQAPAARLPTRARRAAEGAARAESQGPRGAGRRPTGAPRACRACSTPTVAPKLFGGQLKVYRLRFTRPQDPRSTAGRCASSRPRRRTTVVLNGRRLGVSIDPYTPFELEAKGLKRGAGERAARLRRQPQGPAAAGGLVELGRHHPPRDAWCPSGRMTLSDLGLLSDVTCKGRAAAAARAC